MTKSMPVRLELRLWRLAEQIAARRTLGESHTRILREATEVGLLFLLAATQSHQDPAELAPAWLAQQLYPQVIPAVQLLQRQGYVLPGNVPSASAASDPRPAAASPPPATAITFSTADAAAFAALGLHIEGE